MRSIVIFRFFSHLSLLFVYQCITFLPLIFRFSFYKMAIPKSVLGLSSSVNLEFKWSDNMQDEGNIMDFYVNGDVAPGGRFNFVYCSVGD